MESNVDIQEKKELHTYESVYGEKYITKVENLRRRILECETGQESFKVLDIEAGIGKSRETNKIIKKNIEDVFGDNEQKFLVVKRFSADVEECEAYLNTEYVENDVLGITSENWPEWKNNTDKLKEYQVLIVTHQRYLDLCEDETLRAVFTYKRDNLIIDEKINFPKFKFDEEIYKYIQSKLPYEFDELFRMICKSLFDEMEKHKNTKNSNNQLFKCEVNSKKQIKIISRFKQLIMANKYLIKDWIDVKNFIKTLEIMFDKKSFCLYNNGNKKSKGKITACSPIYKFWGLNNNLILDANGTMDASYKTNCELYSIDRQSRIVDHSNSKLHIIDYNSSVSRINSNLNEFYHEIAQLIKDKMNSADNVLLVTFKKHENVLFQHLVQQGFMNICSSDKEYNDEKIAINYFGNLVGKNTYRNFNQIWILGTPNIPMDNHVIDWVQYSQRSIRNKSLKMYVDKDKKAYVFKNKEFEKIRSSYLVCEIYQAVKRIQRNPLPCADIFLINNKMDINSKIKNALKGIKMGEMITLNIDSDNKQKQKTSKDLKVDALIKYLKKLKQGEYNKKEICKYVGIQSKHLSRYLNDVEVHKLKDKVIQIRHKTIIKL